MKSNLLPAIVVEGHQEAKFVKELHKRNKCQELKVIRLNLNGKNVSLADIVMRISLLIENTSGEYSPYWILFDRESRTESVVEIKNFVESELSARFKDKNFIVGVTDRKLEAWMLPFVDENGYFPVEPTGEFEGQNCLGKLEERLGKRNIKYKKMKVGIEILHEIDPAKLSSISESFNLFYNSAKDHCKWMNGRKTRHWKT